MDIVIISGLFQALIKLVGVVTKPIQWCLRYPIEMNYLGQKETNKGYVFKMEIISKKKRTVSIPKSCFSIKIVLDPELVKKIPKEKLVFGANIHVFESEHLLHAFLVDRSYGNVPRYILAHQRPVHLLLLIQVEGPDSPNPSLRFQMQQVYKSAKVRIRKSLFPVCYNEVPIRTISIIAGNEKTRIVESD